MSQMGIIKIFRGGFYLSVFPVNSGNKRYWGAKILNKNKVLVKEFFDSNRSFTKYKAFEWIKSKKQQSYSGDISK